jgi:hypothetical protein
MLRIFAMVDKLLRGGFTARDDLRRGRLEVPIQLLLVAGLILGVAYGAFMGLYSVLRPAVEGVEQPGAWQLLATAAKVPLLFLLTLVVTFPSLYVFSALAGSTLRFVDTLKLLLVGIVVNMALLASFGPVTGFFTLSTESYPFMIILNVIFFAVSGFAGMMFLRKALDALFEGGPAGGANAVPEEVPTPPPSDPEPGAASGGEPAASEPAAPPAAAPPPVLPPVGPQPAGFNRAKAIFYTWAVIYGVVGAQMGWILRPFIGSPNLEFQLFRERESHFFEAVLRTLGDLFG